MKTKIIVVVVLAALVLMVSATVWEGVTDVVSGKDLPGNFSVATNSFPKNSVVDITNLENGKVVRALVVSGLGSTGLLATLSRNAANSINLRSNSTCRIRITQPSDDIAFSHFKLGPVADPRPASEKDTVAEKNTSADNAADNSDNAEAVTGIAAVAVNDETTENVLPADNTADNAGVIMAQTAPETTTEPDARTVTETAVLPVKPAEKAAETTTAGTRTANSTVKPAAKSVERTAMEPVNDESAGTLAAVRTAEDYPENAAVQTPTQTVTENSAPAVVEPVRQSAAVTERPAPAAAEPSYRLVTTSVVQPPVQPASDNPPESGKTGGVMSIVPSEERPPEAANQSAIASKDFAAPMKSNNAPNNVSNASNASSASNSPPPGTSDFSPFQAPLINRMERGKCYVQVAAYQRVDHVEDEINRIGTAYPIAIQNIGTDDKPMFRILLGPLNQGESGATLQRIKSMGYKDAFIRYN